MNYMKKLLKNKFSIDIFSSLLAQVLIVILNLIITKIVSTHFSLDDFGVFNVAKRFAALFAFMVLMGLGISIPKYISFEVASNSNAEAYKYWKASLYILTIGIIITSMTCVIYKEKISEIVFGDTQYSYMVVPIILNAVGTCLSSLLFAYYRGYNRILIFNILQITYNVVLFILAIFLKNSLNLMMWWGLIWIFISLVFIVYIQIKYRYINEGYKEFFWGKGYIKKLLVFGFPRIFGEFALFGYFLVPLIIFTNKYSITLAGQLSVSINFFQLATTFFGVIGYVLLPYVSEKIAKKQYGLIKKQIKKIAILYFSLSVIIVAFIFFFTKQITILFFNTSYITSVIDTKITLFGIIPYVIYLLLRNPLDAISDIPINTINLIISFAILCGVVYYSNNVHAMGLGIIISSTILGVLSYISWNILFGKIEKLNNSRSR
ncbi:hypothetical protein BSK61_27080 [Paenibacillus odorifer]|nr:hypothetical protein BSK61_27080 [Paenibacillus odorifer]